MAKRPHSDLTRLGSIVSRSMDSGFLGLAKEMVRVFEVWEEAVGPYVAEKSAPESYKNGLLTVIVESPVWIDHFGYLKEQFIEQLNAALGEPMVTEITFRVGEMAPKKDSRAASARKKTKASPRGAKEKAKTRTTPKAVQEALADVKDPELRKRLASFLAGRTDPRTK